jgi:hypothetical protein
MDPVHFVAIEKQYVVNWVVYHKIVKKH